MSEDWISARDALDMVLKRYTRSDDAENAIYRYCGTRQIKTNAKTLTFRLNTQKIYKHDITIPEAFWDALSSARLSDDWLGLESKAKWQDWEIGDFSISIDGIAYTASGVTFDREDIEMMLLAGVPVQKKSKRVPAFKRGRAPDDEAILAKIDEMKKCGAVGYKIAKLINLEPGFENVGTVYARNLIKGRFPKGYPKKPAQ